jgi:hypothetical protein
MSTPVPPCTALSRCVQIWGFVGLAHTPFLDAIPLDAQPALARSACLATPHLRPPLRARSAGNVAGEGPPQGPAGCYASVAALMLAHPRWVGLGGVAVSAVWGVYP